MFRASCIAVDESGSKKILLYFGHIPHVSPVCRGEKLICNS